MKTNQVYVTCDYVQHTSKQKAIDHLLNKAHVELTNVLKDCGIDGAYRIAQIIISNSHDNGLTYIYDKLHDTIAYLRDTQLIDDCD